MTSVPHNDREVSEDSLTVRRRPSWFNRAILGWFRRSLQRENSLQLVYDRKLDRLRQAKIDGKGSSSLDALLAKFEGVERSDVTYADLNALEDAVIDYLSPEELASEGLYLYDRLLRLGFSTTEIDLHLAAIGIMPGQSQAGATPTGGSPSSATMSQNAQTPSTERTTVPDEIIIQPEAPQEEPLSELALDQLEETNDTVEEPANREEDI